MKNPWMSAWLSAANSISGQTRNQMMAEMSKAQNQMMKDWQRIYMDACVAMWFPWVAQGSKRRK